MEASETVCDATRPIPVIDLFAGPGGLGEGFSSVRSPGGGRAFQIRLSIEKDRAAHQTLLLRSFFRQFPLDEAPPDYYAYVHKKITRHELFAKHPDEARTAEQEAWLAELGSVDHAEVRERIQGALGHNPGPWVLIGGPPCQAYSLAGRARILGEHRKKQRAEVEAGERDEDDFDPGRAFDADKRHFLYREYLRIIADHEPALFVMENVPGLLSSKVAGKPVLDQILKDLRAPVEALPLDERPAHGRPVRYQLVGLAASNLFPDGAPVDRRDFIVDASEYGVPQIRKRVLIVGIRSDFDFNGWPRPLKTVSKPVSVEQAIGDLPPLRSTLSRGDSPQARLLVIKQALAATWLEDDDLDIRIKSGVKNSIRHIESRTYRLQPETMESPKKRDTSSGFMGWCRDNAMTCTANHHARSHMASDLLRYLFAACYARANGVSPHLRHFPTALLPDHASARDGKIKDVSFGDRFRVQIRDKPSTTVVSHISRDGHYYIHYDPDQCRSLTVREAARLQSFPDNYYFEGNRTEQFGQVGNAVPPLLAYEVARTVLAFISTLVPGAPTAPVPVELIAKPTEVV